MSSVPLPKNNRRSRNSFPLQGRHSGGAAKSRILLFLLLLSAILIWTAFLYKPARLLKATFLDIGQGDSIFLQFPYGGNMLIDGGQGGRYDMGRRVVAYLHRQGVRRIDIVVLSHPHDDHVGGLITVLRNLPVDLVLDSGQVHTSYSYEEFLKLIKEKRIPYRIVKAGGEIKGFKGVKIFILSPLPYLFKGTGSDINNNSLVLKMTYGKASLLFTGDIERGAEKKLLRYGPALQSTLIKVPHHGGRTSSTPAFLDLVNPRAAVISVGRRNPFHHPAPETLRRYKERGVKIYRTDRRGAIIFTSNGRSFRIRTMK
jgi:competence protein ComEC